MCVLSRQRVSRVWVAQGNVGEALDWVRERGLSVSDEPSYLREFEHITLARVLLARSTSNRTDRSIHEAVGLLERLLQAAEEGERTGSVIEILVLQALAHQMQGDIPAALVALQQALTLAEPEGYVRMFVDEGPPIAVLLAKSPRTLAETTSCHLDECSPGLHRTAPRIAARRTGSRRYLPCCHLLTLSTAFCPAAARPADPARIGSTAPHCGWPLQSCDCSPTRPGIEHRQIVCQYHLQ